MATTLSKNVVIDNKYPDEYLLSYYAPKFLWVLRDFVSEIQDFKGKIINPNQYLESSLTNTVNFIIII